MDYPSLILCRDEDPEYYRHDVPDRLKPGLSSNKHIGSSFEDYEKEEDSKE